MKILITGERGLAAALVNTWHRHHVVSTNQQNYNIQDVKVWASDFANFDICINCAYDSWHQITVLEQFYSLWQNDSKKIIVNIGSNSASYSRTELDKEHEYSPYRLHKQALELCFNKLVKNAKCNIKLINPGPIDTDMVSHLQCIKMSPAHIADRIAWLIDQPDIKRLDLWL
jgi:NAD(P)-dependent dehydrogenase (short-subunit alcohol dehydrogenase family)